MGLLDDILGKLVDIDFKPQAEQMGVVNIKTENRIYNLNVNFSTPEAARAFAEGIMGANQTKITEDAEKRLIANSATIQVLPEPAAVEVANAAIVASTAAVSGVEGKVKMGTIRIAGVEKPDTAIIKVSSEEEPKK